MLPDFQIFLKPVGSACNLACDYCYYLDRKSGPGRSPSPMMDEDVLKALITGIRDASNDSDAVFSWHGGEPTLAGLEYFRKITAMQKRLIPPPQRFLNGIQTNGTLLNEEWARFLASESFYVGISLDGPRRFHDAFRKTRGGHSAFDRTLKGLRLLQKHRVSHEILCVVSAVNGEHPLEVYRFFKECGASLISFLPLVMPPDSPHSEWSVPAGVWGEFLCSIFDEWKANDIGRIRIQIIEETLRTAFEQDHSLCIFRETCGRVPVVEHDGGFYACDHYVNRGHYRGNILKDSIASMLDSPEQRAFGLAKRETLPRRCRSCEALNMCHGGCPKNRFDRTEDGEPGLNALCGGYKRFFTHAVPFVREVREAWRGKKC